MPVHLDTHDSEVDLTPGTTKSDIVAFLYHNAEFGYKPAEVRERLDIPHGTATTTLKRLHEAGYVGKTSDSYYHALDREDLHRYVAGLDQLDRMVSRPLDEGQPSDSDADDASPEPVDEAALDAEIAELEADPDG